MNCSTCLYFMPGRYRAEYDYVPAVCRRYPTHVQRTSLDWCGEYKATECEPKETVAKGRPGRPKKGK